jgi:PAS domain S-box-containing protein
MAIPLRLLILEDQPTDAELILFELRQAGFALDWERVETRVDYLARLDEGLDLILADYALPQFDALRALYLLQGRGLDIPFIVVSGRISEEVAVECIKQGAADYLLKDRLARLGPAVNHALEEKRLRDRKRTAEAALRASEQRFRSLFDGLPVGLYRTTPAGQIVDANPALLHMLGVQEREALLAAKLTDFCADPEICEQWKALLASEKGVHDFEAQLRRRDGSLVWVENNTRAVRDADGCLVSYEGSLKDITQRKQAEEALRSYTGRLEALHQIDLELAAQLDLDALLHSIVSRAVELVGGDSGGLYLYHSDQNLLRLTVAVGTDQAIVGRTLSPGEGLVGKAWEAGEPLAVEDHRQWPVPSTSDDGPNLRSVLALPIHWGEQFLGVLDVSTHGHRTFSSPDSQLLSLFAAQAAIAIENARLYQAEREQRELAEALRQAARAMSSSLEPNEILRVILEQLKRALVFDSASVIVLREGGVLDLVAGLNFEDEQSTSRAARQLLHESPILRQMARDLQPVVCADVHDLDGWIWVPGAEHVRSWMGIPLVVHARMIGALMVDHSQPGFFGESEMRIAHALAQHAAQAVENARLYDEARRRSRELDLLNRVIAASATSPDIKVLLQTVCEELAAAFDFPQVGAILLTEEKDAAMIVAESQRGDLPSVLGRIISVLGNLAAQQLVAIRSPLVIDDAQTDPRLELVRELIRQRGIISLLILPFLVEDQVAGILALGADERSALGKEPALTRLGSSGQCFSTRDVNLVQRVAEEVSGALARLRLAETQLRLSVAVGQAAEAVAITDPGGVVLYVNPAFERITGYNRSQAIGFDPSKVSLEPYVSVYEAVMRSLNAGQVWLGRFTNTRPDGTTYTVDLSVAPVRNQAGVVVNLVVTLRDVTRELELEKQFQQAQKMEALGRLAGGIAHDFNNLLTVINLNTQLLQRRLHPEDPVWLNVQEIGETAERAARLTEQLLRFSRQEIIEPALLDLNALIGELFPMLQRVVTETITLRAVLTDNLWLVEADSTQMEQVIINLAVNARDAMPTGGILTIETGNVVLDEAYTASHVDAQPGEHLLLAVSDTGMGMDEQVQARIFEPFFTTKERRRGTGLGLAIVFGIVKQNGGHIRVLSELGRGTTFQVYLPRARQTQAPPVTGSRDIPSVANGPVRGTETVLLVEDEVSLREWVKRVLASCGYQVLVAGNGREALEVCNQHRGPIHLLLADVVMPQMGGQELAEQLRPQQPGMRVLFMSGYADEEIARHGVSAERTALLAKPFTLDELTQTVRIVLDGRVQKPLV